ncbi:MAG TPA: tetratricopeptide repeat protein, partial [Chthoniobacterales bacterium]
LADLNKALELKPNDPQTLERRGLVYYRQKNYQAALDDYNNALAQNATSTLGLSRRADAYVAVSQFDKAKADLETLIKVKPDDPSAQDRLNFVKQKIAAANAPRPTAAASVSVAPAPTPAPEPMDPRMKVAIGAGALLVLLIIIVMIVRKKSRGY